MSFTPQVIPMNIQKQGAENFPPVAQWIDSMHLAANSAASYTIATLVTNAALKGKKIFIIFSADAPFWVNFNGTAAIPTTNKTDGTSAQFSPNQRYVDTNDPLNPITAISFIAAQVTNISLEIYEV